MKEFRSALTSFVSACGGALSANADELAADRDHIMALNSVTSDEEWAATCPPPNAATELKFALACAGDKSRAGLSLERRFAARFALWLAGIVC